MWYSANTMLYEYGNYSVWYISKHQKVLPSDTMTVKDFLHCGKTLKVLKEWTRRLDVISELLGLVKLHTHWPMTNRSTSGFAVETQQKHLGMGCTLSLPLPDFFRPSVSNSDFPSRLVWPGWTKERKKERETFERCFQTEPNC